MARCEGCDGKYGSNGEPEVEVNSEDVNDASISIEVELNIPCGNCGSSPFKQTYATLEAEIDLDAHDDQCLIEDPENNNAGVTLESDPDRFRELADSERTFEITGTDVEVSDDYRPKYKEVRDRKTGEVKRKLVPFRYQTHYYDLTGTVSVRCSSCQGDFEVALNDESIRASELEVVG